MMFAPQWWCSAQNAPWRWVPRAYVGIWVVVGAIAFSYGRLVRGTRRSAAVIAGWAGIATLWVALDWPLGPLGAGHLASAHAMQFLLVTMIAAPLMLQGSRTRLETMAWSRHPLIGGFLRASTVPLTAAVALNLVAVATHVPALFDTLMVSQGGAFIVDTAWLVSAIFYWWPCIVAVPGWSTARMPMAILYLFIGTLFHTGIAVVLLLAPYPLYRVYELAPPMSWISAYGDQQLAGGLMEIGGTGLTIAIVSVMFLHWMEVEEQTGVSR
jgi:cytochrome c oxidase assembly factor CtaG